MTEPTAATTPEFKLRDDVPVDPTDWAARAAAVRAALAAEDLPSSAMPDAMNAFRFLDDGGRTWTYNGTDWLSWNGTAWVASAPPATLKLLPFTLDEVPVAPDQPPVILSTAMSEPTPDSAPASEPAPEPAPESVAAAPAPQAAPSPAPVAAAPAPQPAPSPEPVAAAPAPQPTPSPEPVAAAPAVEPASALQPSPNPAPVAEPSPAPATPAMAVTPAMPAPMPQAPTWPTHITPPAGLAAWAEPNPASPRVFLAPGLPLAVTEWMQNGWARVVASNGWIGWVDGRLLLPVAR